MQVRTKIRLDSGIGFRIQNFQAEADIITVGDKNAGAPGALRQLIFFG